MKNLAICLILTLFTFLHFLPSSILVRSQLVEEGGLSEEEEEALNQLRPLALNILQQEYMKTDGFLLKWLSVNQFDVGKTLSALRLTVAWRSQNGIDTILTEDFQVIEKEVPVLIDGSVDNEGRPLMIAPYGLFDLRKLGLAGLMQKYHRFFFRNIELLELTSFEHYKSNRKKNGSNFTDKKLAQGVFINDLNGFSLRQGGCYTCISATVELLTTFTANYPEIAYRIYVINTPKIFQPVLTVFQNAFTAVKEEAWKVYGYDKHEWSTALLEEIPADQLLVQFGGTRGLSTSSTTGGLLRTDDHETANAAMSLHRNYWSARTNEFLQQFLARIQARDRVDDSENLMDGFENPNNSSMAGAAVILPDDVQVSAAPAPRTSPDTNPHHHHRHHHHFKRPEGRKSRNFQSNSTGGGGGDQTAAQGATTAPQVVSNSASSSTSPNNYYYYCQGQLLSFLIFSMSTFLISPFLVHY